MRILPFDEFMKASGLTPQLVKTLRRRGQIALAWGRSDIYTSLLYFEVDVLGHELNQALASPGAFKRDFAANIVRLHFDQWGGAAAHAHVSTTPVYFNVAEMVRPADPKTRHHLTGAMTTDEPIAIKRAVEAQPQARGFVVVRTMGVNMTGLIADVRAKAKAAGLDFSDPFLPPPDHPAYAEIFGPYVKARDEAIEVAKSMTPRGREKLAEKTGAEGRRLAEMYLADHRNGTFSH